MLQKWSPADDEGIEWYRRRKTDNTRTPVEWHCKMCREPARDGINDKRKSFLSYDVNIQFRYINYLNNIILKKDQFSFYADVIPTQYSSIIVRINKIGILTFEASKWLWWLRKMEGILLVTKFIFCSLMMKKTCGGGGNC